MQISSTLRALSNGTYGYYCPGCQELHSTQPHNRFIGNSVVMPSFAGYIRIGRGTPRCHHIIKDGLITFLDDCRHKMKGTTVELPALPLEYQDVP